MSKLKRAFTILMCILLITPVCIISNTTNVYAVSGVWDHSQNNNWHIPEWFYYTGSVETIDFSLYSTRTYSFSWSAKISSEVGSGIGNYGNWSISVTDENGNTASASAVNGAAATLYCREITGPCTVNITCSLQGERIYPGVVSGGCSSYTLATPTFESNSYVQSNGNLTRPCAYIVFV